MLKVMLAIVMVMGNIMAQTLIIHLDVNGTIMMADRVQGKTAEAAAVQEFAKKSRGRWHEDLPEMRYQDYVEQHLIPGAEADQTIKSRRRDLYTRFLDTLREQAHPNLSEIEFRYKELQHILCAQQDPLYASFWRLVEWAQTSPHDVRFVFRTFGQDIPEIIQLLGDKGYSLANLFAYQDGQLNQGEFEGDTFVSSGVCQDLSYTYDQMFNGIRDDWTVWNLHGETEAYGKPFCFVDGSVSIFFDDNAKEKQIISPKGFIGSTGQRLTTHDLIEQGYVVAVSPLKAMMQPDYFVSRVEALII